MIWGIDFLGISFFFLFGDFSLFFICFFFSFALAPVFTNTLKCIQACMIESTRKGYGNCMCVVLFGHVFGRERRGCKDTYFPWNKIMWKIWRSDYFWINYNEGDKWIMLPTVYRTFVRLTWNAVWNWNFSKQF